MPRMQENSPEKKHEKCQKSCQKHWVADFFSSKTAKTLQLKSHDFSWPSQSQKKTMEFMETFELFVESFLNDLAS